MWGPKVTHCMHYGLMKIYHRLMCSTSIYKDTLHSVFLWCGDPHCEDNAKEKPISKHWHTLVIVIYVFCICVCAFSLFCFTKHFTKFSFTVSIYKFNYYAPIYLLQNVFFFLLKNTSSECTVCTMHKMLVLHTINELKLQCMFHVTLPIWWCTVCFTTIVYVVRTCNLIISNRWHFHVQQQYNLHGKQCTGIWWNFCF